MKRRTFFTMLILFLIFLNSMISIILLMTLRDKLSSVREKCLAEHYVIASALIGDMQALGQREETVEENIDNLMHPYVRYLQNRKGRLAVTFSGEWIYKSSEMMPKDSPFSLADAAGTQKRIVYMENETVPMICIYGNFPAPWQDYGLMYIGDLSDTFSSWSHMKNTLFLMGMGAMLLMALFLFKFLEFIFRPLQEISSTSARIANGDYAQRLIVQGKDETANVAHNFNLMAEQVESQIRQLRDSAEQKQQFIDNFAHELRIPLTAVYGYAEYIQKASISEEERYECTRFIMSECKRLQNLAYQLLDLALLRDIEMKECFIDDIFARSKRDMSARAAEKEIRLSYIFQDNGKLFAWGNPEQLLSLINNLIDNALKASPPKSDVRVSAYLEEGELVMEVEDHGFGMSREQLLHIKEAFYRVDKARSRKEGGAGLGLSICERIARIHHGELTFDSEPGKGTTARLRFRQKGKQKILHVHNNSDIVLKQRDFMM